MNKPNETTLKTASEKMLSLWNKVQHDYKVTLTLHDHAGVFILPDGFKLLPGINVHQAPCCSFNQKSRSKCLSHCRTEAMLRALEQRSSFKSFCWRGIVEMVMPLFWGERHAATIFAGVFRDQNFDLSSFPQSYRKLYLAMPVWRDDLAKNLEQIMILCGYSLMKIADNLRTEYENQPGKKGEILRFFQQKYTFSITATDLSEHLGFSNSHTIHLLKQYFGMGFSALLNSERVSHVERLLKETDLPLREIAQLTGFQNEYYLSKVFKKKCTLSPGAYRKKFQEQL